MFAFLAADVELISAERVARAFGAVASDGDEPSAHLAGRAIRPASGGRVSVRIGDLAGVDARGRGRRRRGDTGSGGVGPQAGATKLAIEHRRVGCAVAAGANHARRGSGRDARGNVQGWARLHASGRKDACTGVDRRKPRSARYAKPISYRVARRARGADRTFVRPARWIEGESRGLGSIHHPPRSVTVSRWVAWKRHDPQSGWRRGRHDASRRGQAAPAILTKRQVLRVVAPAAVADHVPLGKPSSTDCVKHIHDLPPETGAGRGWGPSGAPGHCPGAS